MKGALPLHRLAALVLGCAALTGCSSNPPMPAVNNVDLPRFMGDWYVIADIPAWPERNACNEVESYAMRPDGRVQTTLRFRDGSCEGKLKTMHPVGTVIPQTGNARWNMQFIWPFQAEYVIAYLDGDYRSTIIARSKRDYVWIMARTPQLPQAEYGKLVSQVRKLGYDPSLLREVPQHWPEASR
ncbi:lipocalin family protein [Bordetella sp. FB-8]|uniref:lipocalin family protein n=1 Tax=Bordetella sp. FB-8 TaxID=1159870 RepID=UPI000685220A|nr:lipocalin family protein [Bordetella sp. FB-8]